MGRKCPGKKAGDANHTPFGSFQSALGANPLEWTATEASAVAETWGRAIDGFVQSDGKESWIIGECGSKSAFLQAGDRLLRWLSGNRHDAAALNDVRLAVEERLVTKSSPPFEKIRRLMDRAALTLSVVHDHAQRDQVFGVDAKSPSQQKVGFSPAAIALELDVTTRTLNRYAKDAGVSTPARGQRNHLYTSAERDKILSHAATATSDSAVVNNAKKRTEHGKKTDKRK